VRVQGNVEARTQAAAERLGASATTLVRRGERADVLGPAPAPISRVRGKHRFQLVLRAQEHAPLHRLGRALAEVALPPGVEMSIDIDPVALV
jgi:primosomal protein N' (replication factor Y)